MFLCLIIAEDALKLQEKMKQELEFIEESNMSFVVSSAEKSFLQSLGIHQNKIRILSNIYSKPASLSSSLRTQNEGAEIGCAGHCLPSRQRSNSIVFVGTIHHYSFFVCIG